MIVAAITQALALLILFVVLPFVVAGGVIAFVSWRSDRASPPVRTSEILTTGAPATAQVLSVRVRGGFLDTRPMTHVTLRVQTNDEAFDVEVVQSLPRDTARRLTAGDQVEVRVTTERATAIVVGGP